MSRFVRRGFISITLLLSFGVGFWECREDIERGMIAYRIYHAGILTPPANTAKSEWDARWRTARFYWDFAALRIAREKRLKQLNPELRPLIRDSTGILLPVKICSTPCTFTERSDGA